MKLLNKKHDMFKPLDPILHSELRLSILNILINEKSAEFSSIKEITGSSSGNVSIQLKKLEAAGYIDLKKNFKGSYPLTTCKPTRKGIKAFEAYCVAIKDYLKIRK